MVNQQKLMGKNRGNSRRNRQTRCLARGLRPCLIWLVIILFLSLGEEFAGPQKPQESPAQESLADATHYDINVTLNPEQNRLNATVTVEFTALDVVQSLTFSLDGNCFVTQVFDNKNREVEHVQDDFETYTVRVTLREPVQPGESFSLRFVYDGEFDKESSFSRGSANQVHPSVTEKGVYLPFGSKWFPIYRFLLDRATSKTTITVPLGFTAIGPGEQQPSQVKGITEVFSSVITRPVLPGSLVAGQFFPKMIDSDDLSVDYYVDEDELEACEKIQSALLPYLKFFRKNIGPYPWGKKLNVVAVADRHDYFPGAPGVLYVPHSVFRAFKPDESMLSRKLAYQWWGHTLPINTLQEAWLPDAFSFQAVIPYLEIQKGADAARGEMGDLQVLALQGEGKSALGNAFRLGYMGEDYLALAGGKGAWVIYMLRNLLGEEKFARLLSHYNDSSGQRKLVSESLRTLTSRVAGENMGWFFSQWVDSIGVPEFKVEYIVLRTRTGFRVAGTVKQDRDLFRIPLEIAIETKGRTERSVVVAKGLRTDFRATTETQPVKVVLDPENRVLRDSPELKVAVFIARGRKLFDRKQFVEAIHEYDEALQENPRRSLAHFYLGETFYEQWNTKSAANAFRDALNGDLKPSWIEVWSYIYLGKIFDLLGQRDRAVAEYTKAINTKNNYNGAQAEAKKYIKKPFTRKRTVMQN